ncbi:hypothetical protein ABNF97_12415 [Plantactinospora sp. B6F1]|uniref:hypothetical protein n=1 Tax=Plantactinospora sp. B6F1 TaxID=3158971 RepID=UPI00102CCDDA
MFSTDPQFLLTLHRSHADELRAEADAARLARSVARGPRQHPTRTGRRRRFGSHRHQGPAAE